MMLRTYYFVYYGTNESLEYNTKFVNYISAYKFYKSLESFKYKEIDKIVYDDKFCKVVQKNKVDTNKKYFS